MMEIAQEVAMGLRQNVWVDGSLRDADFYSGQFRDIRHRYPHYRIAMFYVNASEPVIRERILRRAEATGRNVPEHLIRASLEAMDRSLNVLTPLCDFVARISNEGAAPVLKAFETVNNSGSWELVSSRFARVAPLKHEFPNALAPFALEVLPGGMSVEFRETGGRRDARVLSVGGPGPECAVLQQRLRELFPEGPIVSLTPPMPLTLPEHDRKLAGISKEASAVGWMYPVEDMKGPRELARLGWSRQDIEHSVIHLLIRGGFWYTDSQGRVVQVSAVTNADAAQCFVQFGPGELQPASVKDRFPGERWHPPPRRYREADAYAWLSPREVVSGERLGGEHGAFLFKLPHGLMLFPVMA
uniref:Zeta toxin domain-containing protein n=1 Tax=Zooxanthella nutricula TaxID=1333877 RepID=A0A7S2LG65_9DINO|mmetsp:Transcript_60385/g.184473  ORF Transcript_60385/g.184473 Transcript_60385/m.184473 type:complete len:357 (+) Transcript_60385:3-1073(+)